MIVLEPPPGAESMPSFDNGWVLDGGRPAPFLAYAHAASVNWSAELEGLHEEASRTHFLDVWTRAAILQRMAGIPDKGVIADVGCSTGYLLADLRVAYPSAMLIGVDLIPSGLRKAYELVPSARLVQADACALPLGGDSVDAVVSANLLEHIRDDRRALAEIGRILRPGAVGVLVVPAGPTTYDYYDRFLGHQRRYARGELADKALDSGLDVVEDRYIGSLMYPAFWLVKQRNRRRYDHFVGEALERRVTRDIANTGDSRIGSALRRVEERLGLRLKFGVRNLVVVRASAN